MNKRTHLTIRATKEQVDEWQDAAKAYGHKNLSTAVRHYLDSLVNKVQLDF